jgi:hypothetical protein
VLTAAKYKPFVNLTADELVFGYDDTLVSLAHKLYPRNKRPLSKMGLLNGVSSKKTHLNMCKKFIIYKYRIEEEIFVCKKIKIKMQIMIESEVS